MFKLNVIHLYALLSVYELTERSFFPQLHLCR